MVVILPYCIKAKRCEHNALGYWSGLALCLTKVRSSRARCPATALICLSCDKNALEIKHILSADYIFGKCKNHEMPYYIKFLNRKGIEV